MLAVTRAEQRLLIVSAVELPQEVVRRSRRSRVWAARYRQDARAAIRSVVIGA